MKKSGSAAPPRSRREQYAEATRQAIVDAARELFRKYGYFSTKVDDIAALSRVAPATVYAVSGGKQGLLRTLMDIWSTAPAVESTLRQVDALGDPEAIIRLCASTCCGMRKEYGDIMRVILNTAPHDAAVAKTLATATSRYRKALVKIARRMVALGGLRKAVKLDEVVDVLWFYFGYSSLFTLVDENGWSWDRAEKWLGDSASCALLRHK